MNKALYYLRNLQWSLKFLLPEHEVTVETKNGVLSFSNKDWLIGKHLFIHRSYESDFICTVSNFLNENSLIQGDTFCDVGANIGMISIGMLYNGLFPEAIAFEPFPRSFRFLVKNVEQNGLTERIRCFQLALSSQDGTAELEIAEENSGDNRIRKVQVAGEMKEEKRQTLTVSTARFDSLVKSRKISADRIGLIWLDIQGHEGHLFLGAQGFFRERRVPVVSEFWSYGIERSGMSSQEYCKILGELFECFWLFEQNRFVQYPIESVVQLFQRFRSRKEIAQIVLL